VSSGGQSAPEPAVDAAFDRLVEEGDERLSRPLLPLVGTGLLGGIDVGTGVLAYFVVQHYTHNPLLAGIAFSIGFVALLLARSELFTENFLVPVVNVAAGHRNIWALLRLWSITLVANLLGGWAIAWLIVTGRPDLKETAVLVSDHYFELGINLQGAAPGLLSIAPFTGCVQAPASTYSTSSVVDAIACTTPDVQTGLSAQGVGYERFSDPTALTNWYSKNILSDNGIRSGVGDCASTSLIATAKGAQYCEGSFMDNTGVMAHQVLVVAPSAVPLTDGNGGSTTTACPGASSYTLLLVTSPSDNVGVTALACNGAIATAQRFEKALTAGTLDLHD